MQLQNIELSLGDSWVKTLGIKLSLPDVVVLFYHCQSHNTTDNQSVSASWFRALSGAHDQMLITV
jgi:hypothetical protein